MVKCVIGGLFFLLVVSGTGCTDNDSRYEQMVDLEKVSDNTDAQLASINAAISTSGKNANLYARRAAVHLKLGNHDEALSDADQAVKLSKNKPEFLFIKAQALRSLKREGEALNLALQAERNGYQNAMLYVLLSDLYVKLGQIGKAKQYNDLAYKVAPSDEFVLYYRGRIAAASGDTSTAVRNYKLALDQAPAFFEPSRELAGIYVAGRDSAQAQLYISKASRLNSTDGLLWYHRGRFYQATANTDSAIWSYRNAIQSADTLTAAHYQLGHIYYSRGNYDSSIKHLEKASAKYGNTVRFLTALAGSYDKADHKQKALEQYERLIKLEPSLRFAHQQIARLRGISTTTVSDSVAVQERLEEN